MKAYHLFAEVAGIIEEECGPAAALSEAEVTAEQWLLIEERFRTMRVMNMRKVEVGNGNGSGNNQAA